jgi:hypothetical protein
VATPVFLRIFLLLCLIIRFKGSALSVQGTSGPKTLGGGGIGQLWVGRESLLMHKVLSIERFGA